MELTPACDFDQKNRRVARFVAGLAISKNIYKFIKKEESLRNIGAIAHEDSADIWHIVFSARYPFTIFNPEEAIQSAPKYKLRQNVVLDTQAWLAAQSSRPGYLKADEFKG